MNRSILIVICDFLLLSLLTFSTLDVNKVADERIHRPPSVDLATNQVDSGKDLDTVMRLALDEERRNRNQLLVELAQSRQTADERAQQLRQELLSREQQTQRLQLEQTNLQQQFAAAQANIHALNQQLQNNSAEALLSQEKLAAMEAEARKRSETETSLQQQLAQVAKSNQVVLTEKQQLASQLQVVQVENRYATEQATRMAEEVKTERAEKAKLVEGVKALATKSGELAQEVRDNRPLTPNAIFSEFITNRVQARFDAFRAGAFESLKRKEAQIVLVTDGTNTYALCHVEDTPLTLWDPGTDWEGLTGTLGRSLTQIDIQSLSFSWPDPRMVWMPVNPADARQLGGKVYRISSDPYKFQDAVLVGTRDNYYGQCRFEIDPAMPQYVKLDSSFLKGLFGKFNPSRGDLVFSQTAELLGVMVNNTYCLMIRSFEAGATFRFGLDVRGQHTGTILAQLYSQVSQLPPKLQ